MTSGQGLWAEEKRLPLREKLELARQEAIEREQSHAKRSAPTAPPSAPNAVSHAPVVPAARASPNVARSVACGGIVVETNMTYEPAPAVSRPYKAGWRTRRASSTSRR